MAARCRGGGHGPGKDWPRRRRKARTFTAPKPSTRWRTMPTDRPPDLVHDRRPTWQIVLRLAWPVLVQQFLILSVSLYDQFLAGNNAPAETEKHIGYQAAQTTANYISWFISSCSALVSVGAIALVARFVGAADQNGAIRTTNQSILLAVVIGIISTPFVLALSALGHPRHGTAWVDRPRAPFFPTANSRSDYVSTRYTRRSCLPGRSWRYTNRTDRFERSGNS